MLLLVLVVCAGVAVAQRAGAATPVLATVPSVEALLVNIRNWIMGILALVATVFVTIGGVRYLLANGDPGEVEKAKSSFRNAAFGFLLAAAAPVVVDVLRGLVGA
ncbi:pilin [Saccharopolyspora rosea]|uniref:pilin n=1 Tax=Saccharopolyspora rosea TaxID=524884 RepID=UPI0021D8206F|nr:pilin [Saccharopolyspora rosea]